MTSPSEPRTPRLYHAGSGSALPPAVAVALLLGSVATYLVVGIALAKAGVSVLGIVLAGELVLLVLPLLAIRRSNLRLGALGLRRPPGTAMLAAVLIGGTAWYLNLWVVSQLNFDEGHLRSLASVVDRSPLVLTLFVIALVPAVCEEVMFRGAVQRALGARLFPVGAVLVTSVLFAGYHMSLIQLLPTFTLGVVLGALAWRADSVVPSMLAHFLNNAVAILVSRGEPAGLADWIDSHQPIALTGCAVCTLAGIALIARTSA